MRAYRPDYSLSPDQHLEAARYWLERAEEALAPETRDTTPDNYEDDQEPDPVAAQAAAGIAKVHLMLSNRTEDTTR